MTPQELYNKVVNATGADREIDAALCITLNYAPWIDGDALNLRISDDDHGGWLDYEVDEDGKLIDCTDTAPNLTSSVDAVLALIERELPGWYISHIGADATGFPGAMKAFGWTVELANELVDFVQGQAPTLPLSMLAAFLKAKFGDQING